ncbi:hypothetical protein EDD16DRAFT_1555096, partial [Pisolithus croceorrhizus]
MKSRRTRTSRRHYRLAIVLRYVPCTWACVNHNEQIAHIQYSTGLVRADARRLHWAYALRLVYNLAIYALTHLFRDFEHSRTLLWPSGTHSTSLDYQQVAGHWSPSTYRVSMPSVSHFVHEATLPAGYEEEELMLNSASDCIV